MKKKTIKIELQSDLCAGSGYSYAGIVDNDVCYDECGIPFIPSKRLKGVMRETLEMLNSVGYGKTADNLFGKTGETDYDLSSTGNNKIRIGNAYIDHYTSIHDVLQSCIVSNQLTVQEVLGRFTHVVGQTAMENGVADDQTLRYTRVVNKYKPIVNYEKKTSENETTEEKPEHMTFYADIEFSDSDEAIIEDILAAMTHIGLKRNRGFGNVRCTPEDYKPDSGLIGNNQKVLLKVDESSNRILFAVKNIEPLMLSGMKEDVSTDYITAQSVIGLLAGRYLKASGKSASDQAFQDLFVNGKTKYCHLYPCKGNCIFYPAPEYINKLKKTGKLVFNMEEELPGEEYLSKLPVEEEQTNSLYDYRNGNLPKKLKGKYVAKCGCDISVMEVKKEIAYHHRKQKDEILYSSTAVSPGQIFAGSIETTNKEYLDLLQELLTKEDLYFGKSRSAQYGLCRLTSAKDIKDDIDSEPIPSGEKILLTFLSDTVFMNENGEYTVYFDEIVDLIKNDLGLDNPLSASVQTTLLTGYNGKWNLRKSPIPAIKAGSFMVFKSDSVCNPAAKNMIGERTYEGFGRIQIEKAEAYKYDGLLERACTKGGINSSSSIDTTAQKVLQGIVFPIIIDRWLESEISGYLKSNNIRLDSSNSSVGRMKLMLLESSKDSDPIGSFEERIKSIKNEKTKEEGMKLVDSARKFLENAKNQYNEIADSELGANMGLTKTENPEGSPLCKYMQNQWKEYVMGIITIRKYTGGGK